MDEPLATDTTAGQVAKAPAQVEQTSTEYLGRWNRLVSTTNWEKGRIIYEWRQALFSAGAPSGVEVSGEQRRWIRDGDLVEVEVASLGKLRNYVTSARSD